MKKILYSLALIVLISACEKTEVANQPLDEVASVVAKNPPPAANPVIAFEEYIPSGNNGIFGISVMDVDGANKTMVFTDSKRINVNPRYPAWSSDGTKLCLTSIGTDLYSLYTLNIAVVKGVPVGSNLTKIADGVAAGGNYKQGKWRPGQNQIVCVFKKTGDPDNIQLIPSSGGSPTVLYTAQNTDWVIEDDIAFKSDGSNLVFSERQISTGNVYLKIFDVNNSQIINSIDMTQFSSIVNVNNIVELDWAKSTGSNKVAITTRPRCDNSNIGRSGIHQLFTIDISAQTPSLTWWRNDVGNISFSSNDQQITISSGLARFAGNCSYSSYNGMAIFTFTTNGWTWNQDWNNTNHSDWKR